MNVLISILSALASFFGLMFFLERNKRQQADALNENIKTKEKTLDIDKNINNDDNALKQEEQKRSDIEKQSEQEKNDKEDLEKFFNSNNNN